MKICQNCGAEVSDSAKFCRKCGAKMIAAEPAKAQPAETARAQGSEEPAKPQQAEQIQQARFAQAQEGAGEFRANDLTEAEWPGIPLQEENYEWGPPTGGEDYDEQAMPAVLVGAEKEAQEEKAAEQGYTYRIDGPGYDHTDEFEAEDISANKVTAMAAYLLGPLGVIIALLAGQDSPYADFHMRQGLKFVVVEALLTIISVLLCWTLIIPAVAAIIAVILGVIKIIAVISVCRGRAVEPAIIRSLGFLK